MTEWEVEEEHRFLFREKEYHFLTSCFDVHLLQSLFLWGPPSTGKSLILNAAIEDSSIPYVARISAIEIMCGRRPFFETILKQIMPPEEDRKCENLRQFVRKFEHYFSESRNKHKCLIVIDEAEYLRAEHGDILNTFARLQELVQSNVCVVIVSNLPSLGFSGVPNLRCTPVLHFAQYSKEEMHDIIMELHAPSDAEETLFSAYVDLLLKVFYQGCRDLKKLIRLSVMNWDSIKYQKYGSIRKIWKNIEPKLKEDFKGLNSHVLPMTSKVGDTAALNRKEGEAMEVDPYSALSKWKKYILIASYLATHNPPSSDKRFFVKKATRKISRKAVHSANQLESETASERTKGLRTFDLNRLKSISAFLADYCSTGEELYEGNVDWQMQIATLVHSRFLQSLKEDPSGNFKYRCLADYDFVSQLAKSVSFELDKYLFRLL